MFGELRGIDKKLLRDTPTDNASSAHAILFSKGDFLTHRSGKAGSPDPAGPAADNKKIIIEAGHGILQKTLGWPICRQKKKPGQVTGLSNSLLSLKLLLCRLRRSGSGAGLCGQNFCHAGCQIPGDAVLPDIGGLDDFTCYNRAFR